MSANRNHALNFTIALVAIAGLSVVTMSQHHLAKSIRSTTYGAILALVPKESKVAEQVRSWLKRDVIEISSGEKLKQDADRMHALEQTHSSVWKETSAQLKSAVQWIPAKPLGAKASANEIRKSLLLDRGQAQGVGAQALAFTPQGLVGHVVVSAMNESTVILISDEQCQISAFVVGTDHEGILCGIAPRLPEQEPRLILKYLSRFADLKPGSEVRSSGRGGLYPANLLLGTVESFKAGDLYGEALIRPRVRFAELDLILLTRSSHQS